MKRIQKFVAATVMAALIGTGIPAIAAERSHDTYGRSEIQSHDADHRGDRDWNNGRNRHYRNDDRDRKDNRRDDDRSYYYDRDAHHRPTGEHHDRS